MTGLVLLYSLVSVWPIIVVYYHHRIENREHIDLDGDTIDKFPNCNLLALFFNYDSEIQLVLVPVPWFEGLPAAPCGDNHGLQA